MTAQNLTGIELAVITLSRLDSPASLVRHGRISRYLFGERNPLPLASPRLEALRRYAILFRAHGAPPAKPERDQLGEAGFDNRQIGWINDLMARIDHEPLSTGFPLRSAP